MTARADRLTKRAKGVEGAAAAESSGPASLVRVLIEALDRLGYDIDPLLAEAGLQRSDLERDPDARIPCAVSDRVFMRAMQQRPMKS
jgi:hypothetical protein